MACWSVGPIFPFLQCACPASEDATYARMKQFIGDAVPEFQLVPHPAK